MTIEEFEALWKKHDEPFDLKFEQIENPPSKRADLCAFLKLDQLVPGKTDMVSNAEHDEIFLEVSPEELAKVATEEDIIYLIRCGVNYNEDGPWFQMYV